MRSLRFGIEMLSVSLLITGADVVSAQRFYPDKTIRIVTSEPGGSADIASRIIAQGISAPLGQPVIVDNRNGGIATVETVANSQPDGYTVLQYGSTAWLLPFMVEKALWEAKDFTPVMVTFTSPNLVVVNPSSGINSIKDLVAVAKAKPGTLNYVMGSRGTSTHLTAELFIHMTGVKIVGVPYKGNVPGLNAVLSGESHVVFPTSGSGGPFVKSGRLKALAVTSAERSALFPGVPTVAESGVPGYESISVMGILAPAKTPDAIIRRLNREIARVITQPDVKEKFFNSLSAEIVAGSPEEFGLKIKSEMARMGKLIKDVGIRIN